MKRGKVKIEPLEETFFEYIKDIELLQNLIVIAESSDTLTKVKYRVTLEKDGKEYIYFLNNLEDIKFLER